jgi:hypothetical protein
VSTKPLTRPGRQTKRSCGPPRAIPSRNPGTHLICSILGVVAAAGTITARQHCLEEVTEDMRRQRRQAKFDLAVEEGTACLNCRRGKPKWNPACPSCGFNHLVYSAEAAAKKATRAVMKAAVRLTATAAWLTAKATWEITKGTAKILWWSLTPTKKRFSKTPAAV